MHEVVLIAVRNAVSAATNTFTASSMILCFFMVRFSFSRNEALGRRTLATEGTQEGGMRKEITPASE